jgi:hypothetical protein
MPAQAALQEPPMMNSIASCRDDGKIIDSITTQVLRLVLHDGTLGSQ